MDAYRFLPSRASDMTDQERDQIDQVSGGWRSGANSAVCCLWRSFSSFGPDHYTTTADDLLYHQVRLANRNHPLRACRSVWL